VLDRAGLAGLLSLPAAAFAGLILAAGTFHFFSRVFRSVQSSSGVSGRQAIGAPARVITPIPESGTGEIAYVVGGRRFNGPARGLEGRAFAKDAEVVIVERSTGLFVVREKAQTPSNGDEERRQAGES
jgi:membrane-bound ClpP family serine protease